MRRARSKRARRFDMITDMKVYLVRRAFFTFRGEKSYELDLAGMTCLERMRSNLGAEILDGAPPPGEKLVLYPVSRSRRGACVSAGDFWSAGAHFGRGAILRTVSLRSPIIPLFGSAPIVKAPSFMRRAVRLSRRARRSIAPFRWAVGRSCGADASCAAQA